MTRGCLRRRRRSSSRQPHLSRNPIVPFRASMARSPSQRWKTNMTGMSRASGQGGRLYGRDTLRYVTVIDDFPVIPVTKLWADTGCKWLSRMKALRRSDRSQGDRALPPHDHRPRRPRPRPDLRQRHDGLRRRAVGPAVDHDRHQSRVALSIARQRLLTAKYDYYGSRRGPASRAASSTGRSRTSP